MIASMNRKSFKVKMQPSSLAGKWYVASPTVLRSEINHYLSLADDLHLPEICGLILPHAGYQYSGPTAAKAVRQLVGRSYDRVIVLGPSHCVSMPGFCSVPDPTHYETPLGIIPLDVDAINTLCECSCFHHVPVAHQQEHSVQIQLPMLQVALGDFQLIPVVVGEMNAADLVAVAAALSQVIDEKTLVIASSDFTHYGSCFGFVPFTENPEENLRKLDMGAVELIEQKDAQGFIEYVLRTGATICGRFAIGILLKLLLPKMSVRLMEYTTSGALTGDFEHTVGYVSAIVEGKWNS